MLDFVLFNNSFNFINCYENHQPTLSPINYSINTLVNTQICKKQIQHLNSLYYSIPYKILINFWENKGYKLQHTKLSDDYDLFTFTKIITNRKEIKENYMNLHIFDNIFNSEAINLRTVLIEKNKIHIDYQAFR